MSKEKVKISDFSEHLFWDIDKNSIDIEKNKKHIISQVLSYGLINDWQLIYKYYGLQEIANITRTIRSLDDKTISFISTLSNIPKEKFLCYTIKQSIPKHWHF